MSKLTGSSFSNKRISDLETEQIGLTLLRSKDVGGGSLSLAHNFPLDILDEKMEIFGRLPESFPTIALAWINTVLIEAVNGAINFGGADSCALVAMTTLFRLPIGGPMASGQQLLLAISGFVAGVFMGKGYSSRAKSLSEKHKRYLSSFEFVNKKHAPVHDFLTNSITLLIAFELALVPIKHLPLGPIADPVLTSFAGMFLTAIVTIVSKLLLPGTYALRYRKPRRNMSQEELSVRKALQVHELVSASGQRAAKESDVMSWGKGLSGGISNFVMAYLVPTISDKLRKSGGWSEGNIRAVNGSIGLMLLLIGWFFVTDALIPLLKRFEGAMDVENSDQSMV